MRPKLMSYGNEFRYDLTGIQIHEDLALTIIMDYRTPTAT